MTERIFFFVFILALGFLAGMITVENIRAECIKEGLCYFDTVHAWKITRWPEKDRPYVWEK